MSVFALSGCSEKKISVDIGAGLPRQMFDEVPLYSGSINSVGSLTEGYIRNTEGLLTANNRLRTLCIAFGNCKPDQE